MNTTDMNDTTTYASTAPLSVTSAVSWPAVLAGATGSAAISLILILLGTGLGMTLVSPWSVDGDTVKTLGISGILWITLTSLVAAALGGYLAGRLRTRWLSTPVDEVYFRDTAHGFLAWAVATLLTAALLTSTIGAMVKGGAETEVAASAVKHAKKQTAAYFLDLLFRPDVNASNTTSVADPLANTPQSTVSTEETLAAVKASKAETKRIFMKALELDSLSNEDLAYTGQLVARHTGITQQAAQQRVSQIFELIKSTKQTAETAAKEAADKARKASGYTSLWLFISLLIGAFIASLAATYGGRQRDL